MNFMTVSALVCFIVTVSCVSSIPAYGSPTYCSRRRGYGNVSPSTSGYLSNVNAPVIMNATASLYPTPDPNVDITTSPVPVPVVAIEPITPLAPVAVLLPIVTTYNSSNVTFNIQHSSKACVHPKGGKANPAANTNAVFYSLCDTEDRIIYQFTNGNIVHYPSRMCLQPMPGSTVNQGTSNVVFGTDCSTSAAQFSWNVNGIIQHVESQFCIHPADDSTNPSNQVPLILKQDCSSTNVALQFSQLLQTPA